MRHYLFALTLIVAGTAFAEQTNTPAAVVANVNGTNITRDELNDAVRQATGQMLPPGQELESAQRSEIEKGVLDQMIGERLLTQKSATLKIADLDAKVQERIATLKQRFPDEKTFTEIMKANGMDGTKLKDKMAESCRIEALLEQEVRVKIKVTDAEAREFYDKNPKYFNQPAKARASHILVAVPADADEKVKAEKKTAIDAALKRVTAGEDFAKVAGEVSDCPSKAQGGDLDYFASDQMVQPFSDVAFGLKSNEVSQVVTTQFGHHIIKKTGSQPAATLAFEQENKKIVTFLTQQRMQEAVPAYIAGLRKEAKVEVLLK